MSEEHGLHAPKIVVLGGRGDIGHQVVRELVKSCEATIVVAGRSVDHSQKLAAELGNQVSVATVNAGDEGSLQALLVDADAVISCIGPFYQFEDKVAKAALKAGCHYIDICDDNRPVDKILSLDEQARQVGLTLITGLGFTPGITNLLPLKGGETLDELDEIKIAWAAGAADSSGFAVLLHIFNAVTHYAVTYQDQNWVNVPPSSDAEKIQFLPPVGKTRVFNFAHPEPLTIPRTINVKNVSSKGGIVPDRNNKLVDFFAKIGVIGTPAKDARLAKIIYQLQPIFRIGSIAASAVRVEVNGRKAGEQQTISYNLSGRLGTLTGIPAAVGALWAVSDRLPKGAFAPEGCLPVTSFLSELAQRGIVVQ